MTQLRQLLDEGDEGTPLVLDLPVQPADVAVLAIGVVVALLGAAELVARQQHRRALAQ